MVFLSTETWNGPLTIRVPGVALRTLSQGDRAATAPGSILFPGLHIHFPAATCWQAPPRPEGLLPPAEREARLERVTSLLEAKWPEKPVELFEAHLPAIRAAVSRGQAVELADALAELLGLGAGLTPAGDDLACGALLGLARWGNALAPTIDLDAVADALLPQAWKRTTALSASLVECAAHGQADERLLMALDGLITGQPAADECAALLAAYGSSSGAD